MVKSERKYIELAELYCNEGGHDKEYYVWIEEASGGFMVWFKHGRRGYTMIPKVKTEIPVSYEEAKRKFDETVNDKLHKKRGVPYKYMSGGKLSSLGFTPAVPVGPPMAGSGGPIKTGLLGKIRATLGEPPSLVPYPMLCMPISKAELEAKIDDDSWILQEKADGRRMMLWKKDDQIKAFNRNRKEIAVPDEFCSVLQKVNYDFLLDGEACGKIYYAFDVLRLESLDCAAKNVRERMTYLGMFIRSVGNPVIQRVLTAKHRMDKQVLWALLQKRGAEGRAEGAVVKDGFEPYVSGYPPKGKRCLKFKFLGDVTCVVIKINDKRSVQIGLSESKDSTKIIPVGNVTIPEKWKMPFEGSLIDVQYRHANRGGSLQEPVFMRERDDVEVDSLEDLKFKEVP